MAYGVSGMGLDAAIEAKRKADAAAAAKRFYSGAVTTPEEAAARTQMQEERAGVSDPSLSGKIDEKLRSAVGQGRDYASRMYEKFYDPTRAAGFANQQMQGAQGRTAAQLNQDPANQFREQQMALAQALAARAAGTGGPSVAELQMGQGLQQALAGQRSLAASARGINPAMAQRMAAYNAGDLQQNIVGQAAILRAQEQQAAEQALGGLLGQGRGQDLGAATTDLQATMQQRGMNDQYTMAMAGLQQGYDLAQIQAMTGLSESLIQAIAGDLASSRQMKGQVIGGALGAGGAAAGQILAAKYGAKAVT